MSGPSQALHPGLIGTAARASAPAHLGALVAAVGSRILAIVTTWHARAKERRALAAMNDHELRDVGITRADVWAELDKPFWRA
ncbi:MAG: DUF1127 domain-containing protein [Alphaproteobacteria bacterium]|nr:DUF1127 domain-containing protein [Alphaproteobacteria bacterium]